MKDLALIVSAISLAVGSLTLLKHTSPRTLFLVMPKFLGAAFSAWIALLGAVGALMGFLTRSWIAFAIGLIAALLSADYVRRVTVRQGIAFARAFGAGWRECIAPKSEANMLGHRWGWLPPSSPEARITRDVAFATIPGSNRPLLCDIWQPQVGVEPSGTAFVYLHGSAWCLMDKDFLTRRSFRHLAAQGHVVMDVAYRLCPETDAVGMAADAKRAIAWLKSHATEFGVDRDRIVLAGGSAGAHIALLAAYSDSDSRLTPDDLRGFDTSVRAVVSYYGVPDLRSYASHQTVMAGPPGKAERRAHQESEPGKFAQFMMRLTIGRTLTASQLPPSPSHYTIMHDLVGGLPNEVPDMYELASPSCHVNANSPATLLFHGTHDFIIPVETVRELRSALESHGVPVVYIEYPRTDHAFDIMYPPLLGPAGQAALYDLDRFLLCVATMPRPNNAASLAEATEPAPEAAAVSNA